MRAAGRIRWAVAVATTVGALLARSGTALAQYPGGQEPPPGVGGDRFFPAQEGVARTGWDFLLFLIVGLAILLVGLALHHATRSDASREG